MKEPEILVRYAHRKGGPCAILGIHVKTTTLYVMYKIWQQKTQAYISKASVHLEPCRNCFDHPQSKYPGRKP